MSILNSPLIIRVLKSNFIRSSFIFSAASFLVSLIGYVINLLIARTFSLANYGEYMTAMSYVLFLSVPITTFGMIVTQRIGKEIVSKRKSVASNLEKWLLSELKTHSLLLMILAVIFGILVFYKGNLGLSAILFIVTASFLTLFQIFYTATLQAFKNFFMAGLLLIIIFGGKLILSIGVIFTSPSIDNIFTAFVVSLFVGLIFGRKMIRDEKKVSRENASRKFLNINKYLKRKNLLIALTTTLGLIGLGSIDIILVRKFLPADQAGLYSSISLLGKIILYVSTPLSQVAFSYFTGSDSRHNSTKILSFLSVVYLLIGGLSTLAYFYFPELIIGIIFGSKFLVISNLIWLAAIFGTLYSLITLYGQFLISKNSWWGSLVFVGLIVQFILIFINHSSLFNIMTINIYVALGLIVMFAAKMIFGNFSLSNKSTLLQ